MKVFIAGAMGALGLPLVRLLVAQNHTVLGLTRSSAKRLLLERLGATAVVADVFDDSALERVLRETAPTHVVHLLTAIPKNGPLRAAEMATTNQLRIIGTANLLQAAIAAGVQRIVGESFVTVYGYGNRSGLVTEADEPQVHESDPGLQKVVDALLSLEHQLLTANRQGRIEAIPLRYGVTYGPENPSTEYMVRMLRKRMVPTIRGANGLTSFIHTTDAASATLAALEHGRPGEIYNVVDDEPVNINTFLTTLAATIKARPPFALPLWLMRWIAPFLVAAVSVRLPVSNAKAKQELGWALQFPTYRTGVQQIAQPVHLHGQVKR